jgi:hypothetical protein
MFKANNRFKSNYNRLLKKNQVSAKVFLLHADQANEKGQDETAVEELAVLLNASLG